MLLSAHALLSCVQEKCNAKEEAAKQQDITTMMTSTAIDFVLITVLSSSTCHGMIVWEFYMGNSQKTET